MQIIVVSSKPEVEVVRKAESGGGKLLRSHHEPIDMEPVSPGALSKTEKKRGRGRPSNASRKSSRMRSKLVSLYKFKHRGKGGGGGSV